jgi:hypothetical protein
MGGVSKLTCLDTFGHVRTRFCDTLSQNRDSRTYGLLTQSVVELPNPKMAPQGLPIAPSPLAMFWFGCLGGLVEERDDFAGIAVADIEGECRASVSRDCCDLDL